MIRINLFLLLIVFIFSNYLIGEDAPKNIIVIQEDLNSINKEESNISVIQNKQKSNEVNSNQIENQDNFIVIDDIEKEFNEWYGLLPSESGGFGWLMWGDTTKDYALSLLRKTNFNTKHINLNNSYDICCIFLGHTCSSKKNRERLRSA